MSPYRQAALPTVTVPSWWEALGSRFRAWVRAVLLFWWVPKLKPPEPKRIREPECKFCHNGSGWPLAVDPSGRALCVTCFRSGGLQAMTGMTDEEIDEWWAAEHGG